MKVQLSEMAKYIWKILTANPSIPMSWGVDPNSLISSEDALEFHVQGFLFTGNVRVVYIEGADIFEVYLYNEDSSLKERIQDVYLDNLTDVIDEKVEKTADYGTKVMDYLNNVL